MDRFKNDLEKASGSRKDYPHKSEEITKQCLINKFKSIRLKYRQAVDTGKRSGHGRVVLVYYELCESIWGGSPATHSSLQAALKVEILQQLFKQMVILIQQRPPQKALQIPQVRKVMYQIMIPQQNHCH